jgi:hypothetical protein
LLGVEAKAGSSRAMLGAPFNTNFAAITFQLVLTVASVIQIV